MALLAKLVENRLEALQITRIEGWVKVGTIDHLGLPRAEILNDTEGGDEETRRHAKMTPPKGIVIKKSCRVTAWCSLDIPM
ncbi:hypothetical protein MEA186_29797 [Mesorhizobium amorphae CCNWGS0123]|uniref:Uncharacterized protein n=1 Tax=Mesorhizobium amorphae CCNWGS0123 TaxID=1082933 RepID=G6YIY5_9HYPH|nr:hypothetical protein A6B35_30705 [Mesorhizobium amorphae CCNWGS0123]EHH05825.1 hypothetical protein MEA186_29797 [Mesorhizobium amorphae CCNWGS0123]